DEPVTVAVVVLELPRAVALEVRREALGDRRTAAVHVVRLEARGAEVLRVVVVPARVPRAVEERGRPGQLADVEDLPVAEVRVADPLGVLPVEGRRARHRRLAGAPGAD